MDKPAGGDSKALEELYEENRLEEALLRVEEAINDFLMDKLSRDVDYRLVLKVERNNELTLHIDLEIISSRREEFIRLKPLIDDAIRLARSVFEESIKRCSQ